MYDIIIKNAAVLDGSGSEAYSADVAIKDGKIAKIGEGLVGAAETIDAAGLTVSPGFIDSHSHSDGQFLTYPEMREKVEQGITFSVAGQCGESEAPLRKDGKILKMSEYLSQAHAVPQGASAGTLVGFNKVRRAVMGTENREPTKDELLLMCELVRDAIRGGAIGMSYGVFYVPACYAKTDELVAVAKAVAEEGGILAAHIRSEGDGLIESVEEFLHIIKESGCRAVFSHHKAQDRCNWGKVKDSLALIDKANAEGADIYLDVYPYTASGTTMIARFCPGEIHPEGTKNALDLLYNPHFCDKIKAWGRKKWGDDLSWTLVSSCPGHEEYQGKTVSEIAKMMGTDDEFEAALEVIRISKGKARGSFFMTCEEDVEYVMRHPRAMICTDSGVAGAAKIYHPRLKASFPRALGVYARERGVVSVPEMIRKMTSLPAKVYGLKTKGLIKEGMDADLCIFDRNIISDKSDFINFSEENVGLEYVIVNGKIALADGKYNGIRAGEVYLGSCDL